MGIYFAAQGNDDHISTGFTGAASGSMSFSVSCWVYVNTIDPFDYRLMAFIYASARKVAGLSLSPAGAINFGNESVDLVGPVINTGVWTHLASSAYSTSATSAKVNGYVNGRLVANGTVASGSYTGHTPYSLMVGAAATDLFMGVDCYYEEARFWTRALSGGEVLRDYRTNLPDQRGMVGWNQLRDGWNRDRSATAARSNNATWTSNGTAPTVVGSSMAWARGTEPVGRAFR